MSKIVTYSTLGNRNLKEVERILHKHEILDKKFSLEENNLYNNTRKYINRLTEFLYERENNREKITFLIFITNELKMDPEIFSELEMIRTFCTEYPFDTEISLIVDEENKKALRKNGLFFWIFNTGKIYNMSAGTAGNRYKDCFDIALDIALQEIELRIYEISGGEYCESEFQKMFENISSFNYLFRDISSAYTNLTDSSCYIKNFMLFIIGNYMNLETGTSKTISLLDFLSSIYINNNMYLDKVEAIIKRYFMLQYLRLAKNKSKLSEPEKQEESKKSNLINLHEVVNGEDSCADNDNTSNDNCAFDDNEENINDEESGGNLDIQNKKVSETIEKDSYDEIKSKEKSMKNKKNSNESNYKEDSELDNNSDIDDNKNKIDKGS